MNIVQILDKEKAEYLKNFGFHYQEKHIGNKKIYEFLGTDELMKELNSKFEKSSFLLQKNMCF